jgi:hypothetical protein
MLWRIFVPSDNEPLSHLAPVGPLHCGFPLQYTFLRCGLVHRQFLRKGIVLTVLAA